MHQPKYETPRASLRYLVLEMGLCAVLPLLKHLGQFIQATVVKMEDLVLALPARHHQLPTGTCLITVEQWRTTCRDHPAQGGTSRDMAPQGRDSAKQVTKCNTNQAAPSNRAQRQFYISGTQ